MTRLVDLDNATAEDLDRLWHELEQRHASERVEPELYAAMIQLLDEAVDEKRLSRIEADLIRKEMDRSRPSAVLSAYWCVLIPDRPALGAYLPAKVLADAA